MKNLLPKVMRGGVALIAVTTILAGAHRMPAREYVESDKTRGVYLTTYSVALMHHTTILDEALHSIASDGNNEVYINVYGATGPFYPSKIRKGHLMTVPPLTDPLRAALKEARRQGLKPYAFFEYGMMLNPGMELTKQKPQWLLRTPEGKTVVQGRVWLDPRNPEVRAYLVGLIKELTAYKDLEGIQLDDHWGIPRELGDYSQEMTALTKEVRAATKGMKLTLCTNPLTYSSRNYNQNWMEWVRAGLLDEVSIQAYRKDNRQLLPTIENSGIREASRHVKVGVAVFAGYSNAPFNTQKVKSQLDIVSAAGYNTSVFVWEYKLLRRVNVFAHRVRHRLRNIV